MSDRSGGDSRNRYLALVAILITVAAAGFVGYVLYPRFGLPGVEGAGLLGLAAAAGVASFFSPCSFPLLLTLLARQATTDSEAGRSPRPAVFAGALTLGAASFMLLTGVVIALGGEALFAGITFTSSVGITIRVVVGLVLIFLGLIQSGALPLSMHAVSRTAQPFLKRRVQLRQDRPVLGFGVFGFGYVLAGFGWTGPILAGLASSALAVGGFEAAFGAFVAAALVLVGLVFVTAFGVAGAQDQTIERVQAQAVRVKQWGGWILTAVGAWFLVLAAFADFFADVFPV